MHNLPQPRTAAPSLWDVFSHRSFLHEAFARSNVQTSESGTMTITCDLPGVDKDDISITLENGKLCISGERKEVHEGKDTSYMYKESHFGHFERVFAVPENVQEDDISANLNNGVLKVVVSSTYLDRVPKSHQIQIASSE